MRMYHVWAWLGIFALSLASLPPAVSAQSERTFPETGYRVEGRLLEFWQANGDLAVFGLPISEQRNEQAPEGPLLAQWFERERLELHPTNSFPYDVLLGRLGDEALRQQGRDWRTTPPATPQSDCQFFAETSQNVCPPFLAYWESQGLEFNGQPRRQFEESLALFGLPLTAAQPETNPEGVTVLTQWFERARFEYHPNNPAQFQVLLGRLGVEVFAPGRTNPDPSVGQLPTYVSFQEPGWPTALEVPSGFIVEEVASGLTRPRFMALDADGSLVVATDWPGEVWRLRDENGDGRFERRQLVARDLPFVHSVAFVDGRLFAAAEDRVVELADFDANGYAQRQTTILGDLPSGDTGLYGHRTRTLLPGPDGMLYLSIGSSCDVCEEESPLRAAIVRFNLDGSGLEVFASGLRNTVGIAFHPTTNELWGADMGRNNLGPDLPREPLNRIVRGGNYGWPYCYGDRQPNPEFNDPARCADMITPEYEFPAHYAPLGMLFYDRVGFPPSYQGDALIAFHGSAQDQTGIRVGYNVVRVRFKNGVPVAHEDLLYGFIIGREAWGRPAGLLLTPDGALLVSDDFSGRIFRIRHQ